MRCHCHLLTMLAFSLSLGLPSVATAASFSLPEASYKAGAPITLTYDAAISSKEGDKVWITVVAEDTTNNDFGLWKYVDDGATTDQLIAPKVNGRYEVRLHTGYPAKPYNVVKRAPVSVTGGLVPTSATIKTSLGAASVEAGTQAIVKFAPAPVAVPGLKYWVAIVKTGSPDVAFGKWAYVVDGAAQMSIQSPGEAGAYEVRLHGDYPAKHYNVLARLPLTITASAALSPAENVTFKLASAALTTSEAPKVTFSEAIEPRDGERFWITVAPKGMADGDWGAYQYIDAGATDATLKAVPAAGDYEVRLHARYPTKQFMVIHRMALTVR